MRRKKIFLQSVLAKKKLRSLAESMTDLEAAADATEKLAPLQDTIANLQRLSELLDPLESAYADARFFDVDVEQTNQQAEQFVAELDNEMKEEQALVESTDQVAEELSRLSDLIDSRPGKENLEDIRDHRLPAVEAQLENMEQRSRAAKNAPRKYTDRDSSKLDTLPAATKALNEKLATALKAAEDDEKDRYVLALALQLQKLAEVPLDQVPSDELQALEDQLKAIDSPKAREELEKLKQLRKKRAENDRQREKMQENIAKAKEDTKKIEDDVKSGDGKGKKKKGKKEKSPTEALPLADQITALEKDLAEVHNSIVPLLDSTIAMPVDAPLEKKDAEKAKQDALDLAQRINDEIAKKKGDLEREEKTKAVDDALNKLGDKVDALIAPFTAKPQSLTKAENDVSKLNDLLAADLAAVPIDQLVDPTAATAKLNKLKQKAKEFAVPLQQQIDAEKKLDQDVVATEAALADLEKELVDVRKSKEDPTRAVAHLNDLANRLRQLRPQADSLEAAFDAQPSFVAHSGSKPELTNHLDNLLKDIDAAKEEQNAAAQIAALTPEIEQLHELVVQRADEAVPTTLPEQQANLEDLEGRRKKLETLIAGLPHTGPGVEELRAKSEWDLSRLKDLLKRLGDAVGDKMAAVAAWAAMRKDAEEKLVDLTKEKALPTDVDGLAKAAEDLANDEKTLEALAQQTAQGVDRHALDDDEKKKHDNLLKQIEQALALVRDRKKAATDALQAAKDQEKLRDDLARIDDKLTPLVKEADRLLHDAEAIPSSYDVTATKLEEALAQAKPILAAAPSKDPAVKALAKTVESAEDLVPQLKARSDAWNEFVAARDAADQQLDQLRQPFEVSFFIRMNSMIL